MNKPIRKAVRTYLIEENNIVAIKHKEKESRNFYDIPGGKIEENELSFETSIREFKEETGMDIISQTYKGRVIVECPNRIFDFDIYIVEKYKGEPKEFEENSSEWINIEELLTKPKTFSSIAVIQFLNQDNNINLKIDMDNNHKIIKIEKINFD